MPAGEGGRLFLATRDQNFRVNQYRKKLYPEIEGEHLYRATRHFPEIKCSHGHRCTRCQDNLRRSRKNEPLWRQTAEWPIDPVTGFCGCGKQRMEATLQHANGGEERVNAIMNQEIPRTKSVSSLRKLKQIQTRPVTVDNLLQTTLRRAYETKKEYFSEQAAIDAKAMERTAVIQAARRIEENAFREKLGLTYFVRNLPT